MSLHVPKFPALPRVVLGSKSPRRSQLLAACGVAFDLRPVDTDELYPADMPAHEVALYVARQKADALLPLLLPGEVGLTADTVVILDDCIFGKPVDYDDGVRILQQLSGRMHQVITGVCIFDTQRMVAFSDEAKVYFRNISIPDIDFYLEHYQPYDKAGAYAIQEWIGLTHIERIEGTYSNIMGLPTAPVLEVLRGW